MSVTSCRSSAMMRLDHGGGPICSTTSATRVRSALGATALATVGGVGPVAWRLMTMLTGFMAGSTVPPVALTRVEGLRHCPAMREVDVLVVGGGPVGLTASILLSRFGVSSLLVERHPSTSIHPKARGINVRTMEIFRQCGVEAAVRAAGLPPERAKFIVWARSLAGAELDR